MTIALFTISIAILEETTIYIIKKELIKWQDEKCFLNQTNEKIIKNLRQFLGGLYCTLAIIIHITLLLLNKI